MQWYYSENGQQAGPVSEEDLKAKIVVGKVKPDDLVWKDGMGDWIPVSKSPLASSVPSMASETPARQGGIPDPRPQQASPYQSPATASPMSHQGPNIPTYLWQSIAVTILCCPILGIPAIVYAAKVDGLKQSGQYAEARAASNSAKLWCNLSAGSILILFVIYILLAFLGSSV